MGAEGRSGPAAAMAEDYCQASDQPAARVARVAARLLGTPMAAVTMVGEEWVRIRSAVGLEPCSIPRNGSFCAEATAADAPLVVTDALADPRFRHSEIVVGPLAIRFYVGVPLHDAAGAPMGTLCCMDTQARPNGVAPDDLARLADLGIMAAEALYSGAEAGRLAGQHARLSGHFHAVVEAIPLPLITIDSDGLVTDWNPAAEQVFGWTAAEVRGRFGPHVPPEELAAARNLRALDGERLLGVEVERMRRDGSRLPVAISTAPLRDIEGRPEGAVVILEDISERRRIESETAARTAQRGLQAALLTRIAIAMPAAGEELPTAMAGIAAAAVEGLAGCDAGVWLRDPQEEDLALITLVGQDGQPMPPDSAKRRCLERIAYSPDYNAALLADRQIAAEDALTDPRVVHLRESYLRPFGIGAMLSAPIRAGQEVLGLVSACSQGAPRRWTAEEQAFMASLADLAAVTLEAGRRAQAMLRLAAEKDRAEAASRAKSLLLGTMGHELRTPLNAIIGFAELLRNEDLPKSERVEFAEHVVTAGHHLLGVFNAMLDQARIESGALTLAELPVALPALLEDAAGLVMTEAAARGIRLEHVIPPGKLPKLRADAGRLRQAVANLAANAVKFSADGGRVELGADFDPAEGFRIWITDQGPGMALGDLPRAFEPFRQLDEGLRRRAGGAGLGLPLAKAFVEAHGGSLEVASVLGQGTRMTISLPASRALPVDAGLVASAS